MSRRRNRSSNGQAMPQANRPAWNLPPELIAQGVTVPANVIEAMEDPRFWQPWFAQGDWSVWKAFLRALFALPMTEDERAIYSECTGRSDVPAKQVREAWVVVGRRGGKSRIAATVAAYLACFIDWRPYLAAGQSERCHVAVLAADRRQCRVVLRYLRSLITQHGLLRGLVERETAEAIHLTTGVSIEVMTASFRTTRGYSICAAVLDEIAFWNADEDAANAADEIVNAIRPALTTIPGSMLLGISSPHARRGPLWNQYRRYFGQPSDRILVWQAATTVTHPTVDREAIALALEEDPARASAEYLAVFRTDVEAFITREVIDACTVPGRHELPPIRGNQYVAFTDPSGGSGDSFTLCIAHRDQARGVVIDALREVRPPFSPEDTTWALAQVVKSYGIAKVTGDRYAGEWPREQFRRAGVQYDPSERNKSEIYQEALPAFNAHRVELLHHPRLHAQLLGLERRTARGGKDSIDHAPNAHDDLANAACGVICLLAESQGIHVTQELLDAVRRAPHWSMMPRRVA
jgi:hypothetical protein